MTPWPGARLQARFDGQDELLPLLLQPGRVDEPCDGVRPGSLRTDKKGLCVACADRWYRLLVVRPQGRKDMEAAARRFGLAADGEYLYIPFFTRPHRISRTTAAVEAEGEGGVWQPADFHAHLALYDALSRPGTARLSGRWSTVNQLGNMRHPGVEEGSLYAPYLPLFDREKEALARACRRLGGVPFPVGEVAMIIGVSIRFVPVLIEEAGMIKKAQTARGAGFESRRPGERARAVLPLVIPIFLSAFRRADELSVAMEARGYRCSERVLGRRVARRFSAFGAVLLSSCLLLLLCEIFVF